jgi:hypothetical protein
VAAIRVMCAPQPEDKPPPTVEEPGEGPSPGIQGDSRSNQYETEVAEVKIQQISARSELPVLGAIARSAGVGLTGGLLGVRVNANSSVPWRHIGTVSPLAKSMATGRLGVVPWHSSTLPYFRAFLNGVFTDAILLDTGAEVAVISEEFFRSLQKVDGTLELGPKKHKLKGAGLDDLPVIGSCVLQLSADGRQTKSMGSVEFAVVKNLSQLAIVGFPLIKKGTLHKFEAGRSRWSCLAPGSGQEINFPLWTPRGEEDKGRLRSLYGLEVNDVLLAAQGAATLMNPGPEPFRHEGSDPEEDPMSKEISASEVSFEADKAKAKEKLLALERPNQVSEEQWRRLMDTVILPHVDIMVWRNRDPDEQAKTLGEHRIVLKPEASTFNKAPFAGTVEARMALREEVRKMGPEGLGIVRESSSPYASPAFVQRKPGRVPPEWRFLLDCREINERTVKDVYPLPRIDQMIDALRNAKYISTLDLMSGYFQIPIRKEDRHLTAFKYDGGLAEFVFMAQGLCNAPSTFQRIMDRVLAGIKTDFCFAYLDDIIIFSKSFDEHLEHIQEVFSRLRRFNLTVSPGKCHFARSEVRFLGHIVGGGKVKPDPEKISALQHMLPPGNHSQCRSFLGLVNYYRAFVPHFAEVARPLHKAASTHGAFELSEEALLAFHQLKWLLQNAPVLQCSEPNRRFYLSTDASQEALGAVLGQFDENGNEYVVSYASRALQGAEKNYPVTEQEGLAVVWAIRKFADYLGDREFTLTTDHSALKQLLQPGKLANGRMLRWVLSLQPYTFVVVHRAGKKHQNADALSRMPQSLEALPSSQLNALEVVSGRYSDLAELVNEQRQDSSLEGVWQVLLERDKALSENRATDYKRIRPAIAVKDLERIGAFIRKHRLELDSGTGLVVRVDDLAGENAAPRKVPFWPRAWQKDLVAQFHDDDRNGHPGQQQQFRVMREHAYWPRMLSSIEDYIAKCNACQAGKSQVKVASVVPTLPMPVPSHPFSLIGMDALALPKTRKGNNTLVVFTDYLTRWVEAAPMRCAKAGTPKATQVAEALMEHVVCRHGLPGTMLSDQGTGFCLEAMKLLAERMGIKQKTTAPYHPQANGLTERFNRTFIGMLRTYPQGALVREWDERLPLLLWAYRCHYNLRSKRMPFYMLYGRKPRLPGLIVADSVPIYSRSQWLNEMIVDLPRIWSHAAAKLSANAERIEAQTAKLIEAGKLKVYEPFDKVRVRIYAAATSKVDFKDKHIWRGPMTVTKRITPSTYEVEWIDENRRRNTYIVWSGHMQPASDAARARPAVQAIQKDEFFENSPEIDDDEKSPDPHF